MARRDYYAVLGVRRNASADDIKKAFRALAKEYHPDKSPDDVDAQRKFVEIVEAYETLSDPERRARYDKLGPLYRPDGKPPSATDLNDIVQDALSGLFGRRQGQPGEDLRLRLSVTLEEAARGVEKRIEIDREVTCTRCGGDKAEPDGGRRECTACGGSGQAAGRRLLRTTCPRCDGRGYVIVTKCSRCNGEGRHPAHEALQVKVPRGVASGQKLKVQGKGNAPREAGLPGDLYVLVEVADHPLFVRRGKDLVVEAPLTLTEAALGANLEVPTLDGTTTIRIPPGTPSNKVFRLQGRGLPGLREERKGDLHVKVVIEVPLPVTDAQRSSLLALDEALRTAYPQRNAFKDRMRERT